MTRDDIGVLGKSIDIEGNVSFSGALQVDGCIRGNVHSTGGQSPTLIVSKHGSVYGEIRVSRVTVNGHVTGAIHASDHVELQPGARVIGDIRYGTIEIQLGAIVAGRLIHEDLDGANKVVSLKPVTNLAE